MSARALGRAHEPLPPIVRLRCGRPERNVLVERWVYEYKAIWQTDFRALSGYTFKIAEEKRGTKERDPTWGGVGLQLARHEMYCELQSICQLSPNLSVENAERMENCP